MIKKMMKIFWLSVLFALAGCGATNPPELSEGHISAESEEAATIPEPVIKAPVLPAPEQRPNLETYTVIVNQVPVRELLFSMARDAELNLDIESNIKGTVTMNAIDQTLPQILERLMRQVNINYRLDDGTLFIMQDRPYLHLYDVDYLNMSRSNKGSVAISTQITSTGRGASMSSGGGGGRSGASSGSRGGSNSKAKVTNISGNHFWQTLAINISSILEEENKASSSKEVKTSVNIIVNRESGIIGVRATARQHKQISEFLSRVGESSQRQVLIEATLAEVRLSDHYQAGVDWSLISETQTVGGVTSVTKGASQNLLGGNLGGTPFFELNIAGTPGDNDLTATLKALETFGDVKVLSSPKIMAINNQMAILKVVDNEVYFTIDVEPSTITTSAVVPPVIDTNVNTVPVGFVMSVMPYIDKNDVVTLQVRPSISRIVSTVLDPNPALADAGVISEIPVIQVREVESVLKINSGDTAVIGGLMQDQVIKTNSGVPILSSIPLIGALFSYQDEEYIKSELIIFIRPVVIHDASLTGDLKNYRKYFMEELETHAGDSE